MDLNLPTFVITSYNIGQLSMLTKVVIIKRLHHYIMWTPIFQIMNYIVYFSYVGCTTLVLEITSMCFCKDGSLETNYLNTYFIFKTHVRICVFTLSKLQTNVGRLIKMPITYQIVNLIFKIFQSNNLNGSIKIIYFNFNSQFLLHSN